MRYALQLVAVLCLGAVMAANVGAQTRRPEVSTASGGIIQGAVTTERGTIALGGVLVSLASERTTAVPTLLSESDGTFRFEGLPAGEYRVAAALDGFETFTASVTVQYNETVVVPIDLRLAFAETVTVVAAQPVLPGTGTLAAAEVISGREIEEIGSSGPGGIQAALRLFASVIEVPGGLSIKGGLPNQASVQIGPGTFVDPATGLSHARLPDDAIESVKVLPNPYSVEFGRFSSGLVVIETRRATDRWRTRLNNLDPAFRTERDNPFVPVGIASFAPRLEIGGPLVSDRLSIQEALQYRYRASDVPSRPPDQLRRSHGLSSFTRIDATLSPRHTLVGSLGLFPNVAEDATLGTFIPPPATVDIHSNVITAGVTERTVWTDALFSETTFEINQYRADVRPQDTAPMELLPSTTLGRFYNRHDRSTGTYQFVHSLSGSGRVGSTLHLFKGGIDVLYNQYDSTSVSQPVLVHRVDGTLARRLDYDLSSGQSLGTTDVALFVQDRIQPGARYYVELGGRLDRDGVLGRWNVTPRAGAALLLNASGTAVLRGGIGLFFERTPSAFGVFEQYEAYTETRYDADGLTPLGPSRRFVHDVAPDKRTSRSLTWDVAYDHRFNPTWAVHVGVIDRRGSHEAIVEPVVNGDEAVLLASTEGQSRYRDLEAGVHFTYGTMADINATYSRAIARADLNAFTGFFDSVQTPVFGVNAYGPAKADVPHRLLLRGRVLPTPTWLFVAILDWRTGLPYSTWNEYLDYVGPRNERRFPDWFRAELGLERRFTFGSIRPWIGVRVDNAFRNFLPVDVQANTTAPDFGSFYNSEYRQLRIQLRFAR
jgi:hypothetical protein